MYPFCPRSGNIRKIKELIAVFGNVVFASGKVVAEKSGGKWRITEPGAGVHHKVALSEGGTEDPANLVLLSASAHALEDARRRRGQ